MNKLFKYIINFFETKLKSKTINDDYYNEYESTIEENVLYVDKVCENFTNIVEKRIEILKKIHEFQNKQKEFQKYNNLTQKDIKKIEEIIKKIEELDKNKEKIKMTMFEHDRSLDHLKDNADKIPQQIEEIEKAERNQIDIKRDISYIEAEKQELNYKNQRTKKTQKLTIILMYGTLILFSIITLIFTMLFSLYDRNIFVSACIIVTALIFWEAWLYILKRQMDFELKRIAKLQVRGIQILNKTKIKYVNVTNFLEYEYGKYKVRSSTALRANWEKYQNIELNKVKYKQISDEFIRLDEKLEEILKSVGLNMVNYEEVEREILKNKQKIGLKEEISKAIIKLENELEQIEEEQKKKWERLIDLQENDNSENKVIKKIIDSYLEDIGDILEKNFN